MKSKNLNARLLIAMLASGMLVNCGQNAKSLRSNSSAIQRPARNTITGSDASRNTITILRDATPDQCPTGGKVALRFDDLNGNGLPDDGEQVRDTTIHCHANGTQHSYSVQNREYDPDSQSCPGGGVGFVQYIDKNGNGAYDPAKGDQLLAPAQTKCASKGSRPASIGATIRPATEADCPLSGGKGQVVRYFFDLNSDSKYEPDQGDSIVAEVPACATPKNLAAIQAVVPTVSSVGACNQYAFTLPSLTGGAPGTPVTIKSCGNNYSVGFLDTTPAARTCPSGGVMLAFYIDEDHDGMINTASERGSVISPFPLCFKAGATDPRTIAVSANHVTSLATQCAQAGGAGTVFTAFLSKDGSGILKNTPGDTLLSTVDVCDQTDGTAVTGAPLLLPESRVATADEVKIGHCSGNSAVVTQSRLFPNLSSLQGWLRNRADENNQGRLLGDANIVCSTPAANAAPAPANNTGTSASSGGAGGTSAAPAIVAPLAVRNATSIIPAADGQCTDGSQWSVISFKDHVGSGAYDPTSDGPLTYSGCIAQATANPAAQPLLDGTHSELHLTKLEANPDFPFGGYTISVYDRLAKNQALDGVQHEDFAVTNGPAGPATAINLVDLKDYRWNDPKKAPTKACEGVAVVNFYDTVGDGVFTPGKTPVLNELPICEAQDSGLRVRPSLASDEGCRANAGLVFEEYIDSTHAGRFVEGDPITESVAFCPPPAVQPPAQAQSDCVIADATIEGRVTRLTNDELAAPDLRANLPYTLKTGRVGLTTYGAHLVSPEGGTNYLKNTQVLYRVSFGLPEQDSLKSDVEIAMTLTGVRAMNNAAHTAANLFCLIDADATECSGRRYEGAWEKNLNASFWKDIPNGEGKATLENEQFSKRIEAETRLAPSDRAAYKHIPGLSIDLGDMFPDLDQSRFLYSALGNSGTREFVVEIADDIYASRLHFQATTKLEVCRNVAPPKTNALLAAATSGS